MSGERNFSITVPRASALDIQLTGAEAARGVIELLLDLMEVPGFLEQLDGRAVVGTVLDSSLDNPANLIDRFLTY